MVLQRVLSMLGGSKRARLVISPKGDHHFLVNSPDLPGFSMMLVPSDIENRKALSSALSPALEIFIAAGHQEDAKGKVRVTLDRRRPSPYEINARWRAA
jgi:hypothetical protein